MFVDIEFFWGFLSPVHSARDGYWWLTLLLSPGVKYYCHALQDNFSSSVAVRADAAPVGSTVYYQPLTPEERSLLYRFQTGEQEPREPLYVLFIVMMPDSSHSQMQTQVPGCVVACVRARTVMDLSIGEHNVKLRKVLFLRPRVMCFSMLKFVEIVKIKVNLSSVLWRNVQMLQYVFFSLVKQILWLAICNIFGCKCISFREIREKQLFFFRRMIFLAVNYIKSKNNTFF